MLYSEDSNVEYAKRECKLWLYILSAAEAPGVSPGAVFKLLAIFKFQRIIPDIGYPVESTDCYSHFR